MGFRDILVRPEGVYLKDVHGHVTSNSSEDIKAFAERHGLSSDKLEKRLDSFGSDHLLVDSELGRFRVHIEQTVSGLSAALRLVSSAPKTLSSLGMAPDLIESLLHQREGLVLFAGKMGSGKTTSASSYVHTWLSTWGGTCVSLEDPHEVFLDGRHGEAGLCNQCELPYSEFAERMVGVHRHAAPEMVFLGEIREPQAMGVAVLAACSGPLVVATIHAPSLAQTVERAIAFTPEDISCKILAESLAMLVWQNLQPGSSGLQLSAEYLEVRGADNEIAIREVIRQGELQKLPNQIEMQETSRNARRGA